MRLISKGMSMNKLLTVILSTGLFLIWLSPATAAESVVTWTNPDKFHDIRPGNLDSQQDFTEQVFTELSEHFAKLAALLPAQHKLTVNITNIDLAGDVRIGAINAIRIIKNIYPPRLKFSYQLIRADGSVVIDNTISLRDSNFMAISHHRYRNDLLGYEKKMLDKWFKKAFKAYL